MSNHPNQEIPAPRPISGLWRHGRCGVVVLINTLLEQKLHQVAILYATVRLGLPTPDAHAADTSADVGIVSQIGRAHVCTPVTNAHPVCRLLLGKKNNILLSD